MAWFCNYYVCERCGAAWQDEWSCMCEDDCPQCEARHMSPSKSDDLTDAIEQRHGRFVVLHSPDTAEDDPDYRTVAEFASYSDAETFLAPGRLTTKIPASTPDERSDIRG
jgi:hypothetical protein